VSGKRGMDHEPCVNGERGISRADWVVAAGAVALAAFLFLLDWYGGSVVGLGTKTGFGDATGWEAFTDSRWVWLATIVVALASLPLAAAGVRRRGEVQVSAVVFLLGVTSSVLIAYRIAHHPSAKPGGKSLGVAFDVKTGIWLGLAAALTIAAGACLRMYAERPRVEDDAEPERPQPAFSGLTASGPRSLPGGRRPGRAP